jgi:DNA-binding MarR family transcriptional regulator
MSNGNPTDRERAVTLIALLRRTTRLMVEEITERIEATGYPDSPPSFHPIFENIDPEGTRLTVLAARAGLSHQAVGQVVTELERRGFVERVRDEGDGRARLVRLTEEGRRMVRVGLGEIAAIERKWTARWRRAGLDGDLRVALAAALAEEDDT